MDSAIPAAVVELRVLPIDQLIPAAYNPRLTLKPTDRAYRKLEASLREFGLVEPLIWNELTGRVVGGHARLAILRAIGVIEVPVSVVRLSDRREKALNIVLNNQEAQGRYDPARLADLLDGMDGLPELEMTGFDPDALPSLRLEPMPELRPVEDADDRVTVILEMDRERLEMVRSRLDALIAEFDLTSHIRHE